MYYNSTEFEYTLESGDVVGFHTQVKGYGKNYMLIVRVVGVCVNGKWNNPYFMRPSESLSVEEEVTLQGMHSSLLNGYSKLLNKSVELIKEFKEDVDSVSNIIEYCQEMLMDGYSWQEEEELTYTESQVTLGDIIREQMKNQ